MNKLYSVHDHWTDIGKKNDVDIESIDGVITGIKVNGEDYGGGETWNTLFDENVTTEVEPGGTTSASELNVNITADTIKVTFNNTEYICNRQVNNSFGATVNDGTGEFDFSEYPFAIMYNAEITTWYLITSASGTYSLKIEVPQSGGGESDFSTVEVTIINNSSSELHSPSLVWHDDEQLYAGFNIDPNSEATFDVVLYKGEQALDYLFKGSTQIEEGTGIAVTGNIENRSDEYQLYIVITGNGTITIS